MPEAHQVPARAPLLTALAIVVALVGVTLVAALLLRWRHVVIDEGSAPPREFATVPVRLQPAPQPDRAAYFAAEQKRLQSWGWVDREHGIAHIPIDVAISVLAGRSAARHDERSSR